MSDILQAAMGWTNSTSIASRSATRSYGMHADDYPDDELDEAETTLLRALGDERRFSYEYDFGDGWEHEVVVEAVAQAPRALKFAVCLGGENNCPPEDCGGTPGYAHLLDVLADPSHEEHADLTDWLGGPFDPTSFDLAATNVALQQVR